MMNSSGAIGHGFTTHVPLDATADRRFRLIVIGAATFLTALAAQFSITLPFTPIPLTLQPTVVLLAGVALGARAGAASQATYLAIGLVGMPVFAWSPILLPGLARLIGPTGGYLLSYPVAAFAVGTLIERGWGRSYVSSIAALAVGMGVILTGGLAGLLVFAPSAGGLTAAFQAGVLPFLGADLIKVALVAPLVPFLVRSSSRHA